MGKGDVKSHLLCSLLQALLLLDVDFVPSPSILAEYKTPEVRGVALA